jgi:predicted Rossmann fold flavoprotein
MDVSGTLTQASRFEDVVLAVDLLPERSAGEIETALRARDRAGRRTTAAILGDWLPNRLAESIVVAQEADKPIAELSRPKLRQLVTGLKASVFPIHGTRGFEKAEVTAGGVKLTEVNPRTMESRIAPGLYIAGEVLDVDGWIGGYNFQAAFSTGRAAGIAASIPIP